MKAIIMEKTTNWMPAVRHWRSHIARCAAALGDDVMAVVDALMRISCRTEGSLCSRGCCLLDQTADDLWVRDESNVAGVDLTRCRAHTLGVEMLEIRIQRVILGRHQIPRRNCLSRRRINRRAEYRVVNRLLRSAHDSCCTFRQIGGEHIVDLVASDVEEASSIGPQRFAERGRILVREGADGLVRL